MFYSDIKIKASKQDIYFIHNKIFKVLHGVNSRKQNPLKVAVDYPQLKKIEHYENKYADLGRIVRFFADTKEELTEFLNQPLFNELIKYQMINKLQPQTLDNIEYDTVIAFHRMREHEMLKEKERYFEKLKNGQIKFEQLTEKQIKNGLISYEKMTDLQKEEKLNCLLANIIDYRKKFKEKKENGFHFSYFSKSNQTQFNYFISRIESTKIPVSKTLEKINAYGVSNTNELVYFPKFSSIFE